MLSCENHEAPHAKVTVLWIDSTKSQLDNVSAHLNTFFSIFLLLRPTLLHIPIKHACHVDLRDRDLTKDWMSEQGGRSEAHAGMVMCVRGGVGMLRTCSLRNPMSSMVIARPFLASASCRESSSIASERGYLLCMIREALDVRYRVCVNGFTHSSMTLAPSHKQTLSSSCTFILAFA